MDCLLEITSLPFVWKGVGLDWIVWVFNKQGKVGSSNYCFEKNV